MHVYVITNRVSGAKYVGKANDPAKRWIAHQTVARHRAKGPLHLAMRELGAEAFEFRIVEECDTEAAAYAAERRWIADLRSDQPGVGYNSTSGGQGLLGCKESTRRAMSAAKRGKRQKPESVAARAASIAGNGKKARAMAAALELHRQGLDGAEIGRRIGRTRQRVYELLSEAGVRGPGTGQISETGRARQAESNRRRAAERRAPLAARARELASQGMSGRAVARATGLTPQMVRAILAGRA